MKNILLTLALIVSFNLNSQTNSDVKSVFTNDLDKFFQYSSDKNFTKLFDLINPKLFNLVSREQLTELYEMTLDEERSGMKFNFGKPTITSISNRFDFEGYKYYMIYYKSTLEIQIVSEEYISVIENLKDNLKNEYSKKSDSFEFDTKTNTFKMKGLQQSMIASNEDNTDNWKYIEYKTDSQTLTMMNSILPSEVLDRLTK